MAASLAGLVFFFPLDTLGFHTFPIRLGSESKSTTLCRRRNEATVSGSAVEDIDVITQDLELAIAQSIAADAQQGLGSLDLIEELSTSGMASRPWSAAFRTLACHPRFVDECWGKRPFRLVTPMDFAIDCFTLRDLEAHAHFYPLIYAGSGTVLEKGGWMMARLDEKLDKGADPMSFSDVEASLGKGTLSLNSAGFFMPPLASICGAVLEAFQLPIWLNIYITEAGRKSSAPCHTDKQDVVAVQSTGSKRWRVFAPPPPANKLNADAWARGKAQDVLSVDDELGPPLLDVVLEPGQLLYIPAGFPHITDTNTGSAAAETSIHLTLGVDTHVWDLNYVSLRNTALRRKKLPSRLEGAFALNKLEQSLWNDLHAPLPLGFTAAPVLHAAAAVTESEPEDDDMVTSTSSPGEKRIGRRRRRRDSAQKTLTARMASECARRMLATEPKRWSAHDESSLVAELDLDLVAAQYLQHYQRLITTQRKVYADGELHLRAIDGVFERARPYLDEFDAHLSALGAWADGKDEYASVTATSSSPASTADGASSGVGMSGKKKGYKNKNKGSAGKKAGGFG